MTERIQGKPKNLATWEIRKKKQKEGQSAQPTQRPQHSQTNSVYNNLANRM